MLRTSYVHHQEDYTVHAALYGIFFFSYLSFRASSAPFSFNHLSAKLLTSSVDVVVEQHVERNFVALPVALKEYNRKI
jgi:hypothetical protein